MKKAIVKFAHAPELVTYPGGQPTNKRHVYIVAENSETDIPADKLYVNGKFQLYPYVEDSGNDYVMSYRKKSSLVFRAGSYIGLIPLNDSVMLDVKPRVPLKNLTHVMRIAEGRPREIEAFLSYYSERVGPLPSMLDVFARAFVDRIAVIGLDGLHREYKRKSDSTAFPRGRIHIGETMRRHTTRGIRHHATASWFEPTVDTEPNRCLKHTLWFLAAQYNSIKKRNNDLLQRLERSYHLFSGVTLDTSLGFLRSPTVTNPETMPSIRAYYKPALYLALLILRNGGISFIDRTGRILMPSLLISLQTVFEKYSRNVLRARLSDLDMKVRVLDGNLKGPEGGQKLLFDDSIGPVGQQQTASPDIVFMRTIPSVDGSYPTLLVADVKYKKFAEPKREDIEQANIYAVSYRAPVVIIHPCLEGQTHGMHQFRRMGQNTFYHYRFDLAANNPEEEERIFAKSFRSLLHV